MNSITLCGRVADNAQMVLVKTRAGEKPLVTFPVLDTGLPYQQSEPMLVEVHFMHEAAPHIYEYLVKGKPVEVFGFLRRKDYVTQSAQERTKYYISADYVGFPPKDGKEKPEEEGSWKRA